MKKKIAVCNYYMGMGGTEKAMLALFDALDPEKIDVTLYLLFKEGPLLKDIPDWINVELIPFVKEKYRAFVATRIPYTGLKQKTAMLSRKLTKMKEKVAFDDGSLFESAIKYCSPVDIEYDAVLDFYGYASFTTVWARKVLKGKKYATWLHDTSQGWTARIKEIYPLYDKIFPVSAEARRIFVEAHSDLADKTEVFLNIIDCKKIVERSKEVGIAPEVDKPLLVTVGRICKQKGQDLAIEIAAVLKERGVDFQWLFIGPGDEMEQYQKLIEESKVGDRVQLLGMKKNPYPYMKNSTVYVQPSRHEGYAVSIVEAKALNLPIVTTDIACMQEQIESGVNGYLVHFEKHAFADRIQELINSPETCERFRENLMNKPIDFSKEIKKLYQLL